MNASGFLVTGGTGSLGSRVATRLHNAGHEVRALSRSGRDGTVKGDLLTGEGLEQAMEGVDVIVHCASSPTKTRQTDVEGTDRLLQAPARQASRTSSSSPSSASTETRTTLTTG